ncbi:metal-dependent transcriptional regulator, partial [Candidatus Bathyarchaeota archaeon]|nr:metal-dependent transcriptional regulator [Candidatus Bathyarchaeota archaeon]
MATAELSQEAEEYLEAIYKLQSRKGIARTTELAEELNVVPGSVTNTLTHLEKHGLVKREPYRGVKLTRKGEKIALTIIRKHRLAERLLTDILEVDWSEVHEKACKLEHALTEDLLQLLEKRLGYPKVCPHGNPIPSHKGEIEEVECKPLTSVIDKQPYIIVKVIDEQKTKLTKLARKGVKPNTSIHIVKKTPKKVIVCINGKEHTL